MRILLCWLLISTLAAADEAMNRRLRALLTPTTTTPIPVEDQVPEEENPGAAVPS